MNAAQTIANLMKLELPEYAHLSEQEKEDGYKQMCQDLLDLARKDGCIAAAFALSVFESLEQLIGDNLK